MGENDADEPTPPRGIDADEYRRFLEFQRFQDYQRFVQAQQGGTDNLPVPVAPAAPPPQPPHQAELADHLAGMRQQLARIEKVTNPPTWQKILRNKWLHRAIWLVVLIVVASIGVPKLIHHYFGGGGDQTNATAPGNLPAPVGQSGVLPPGPHDAVQEVYMFVGDDIPAYHRFLCTDLFTPAAAHQFGAAHGDGSCTRAMDRLHAQVRPGAGDTYGAPDLTQLPSPTGSSMVISSCDFTVTDGPRLGTFTVNQVGKLWRITGYAPPTTCPSSAPPT